MITSASTPLHEAHRHFKGEIRPKIAASCLKRGGFMQIWYTDMADQKLCHTRGHVGATQEYQPGLQLVFSRSFSFHRTSSICPTAKFSLLCASPVSQSLAGSFFSVSGC